MNFDTKNSFEGGYSKDVAENLEKNNTCSLAKNGRVYSKNGTFGFASIEGSKLAYQNNNIVKWLGGYSFREQAIVWAKCLKPTGEPGTIQEEVCENVLSATGFEIVQDVEFGLTIELGSLISENSQDIQSCYTISKPAPDPTDFDLPYSEVTEESFEINFEEYYDERYNVADYKLCNVNIGETPVHNREYYDCIISFKWDDQGALVGERLWIGMLNIPINAKITAEGVEENEFYKRVYFTDAVNHRRVVNVKDISLSTRNPEEFSQILDNTLLQPLLKRVDSGGQLRAMSVMYTYRIISEQGQVSEFSPFSEMKPIVVEDEGIGFRGGNASEATGKVARVKCNIVNPEPSAEVECFALEFQALGVPTAIRNLGLKGVTSVVEFDHFGNEPELIDNVTIQSILEFKNTWKYANAFTSEKNKLIAAGLRNNPIPTGLNDLEYLLPFHAWNKDGETFNSLINPRPWEYRFIDPSNNSKLIYIKQKKYTQIASFGPMELTFFNSNLGSGISKTFYDLDLDKYTDVLAEVIEWLVGEQTNNPQFQNIFPNIEISNNNGQLLIAPVNDTILTDVSAYLFKSNNDQFIENFNNDLIFTNPQVNTSKLVHGAESIGFNQGNGVRVTFREFKEPLLKQASEIYTGTGKLMDYNTPSMEKFCMKGEIYRLALGAFDNASSRYFAIPLGDIMVPELGDMISYIDNQGNAVIEFRGYENQSVENGILYGHGIKMHIEVRLDCEVQKLISMYQILYVERTEENRTILCQGISAPLFRTQFNGAESHKMPEDVLDKWTLPYYGGPVYDKRGFQSYDTHGENWDYDGNGTDGIENTLMTSRSLMYFDSPDLYYRKISDEHVKECEVEVVAKLNTDHGNRFTMERGDWGIWQADPHPKFSRKITEQHLEGNLHLDGMPRRAREEDESGTHESYFINVSVFAKYQNLLKKRLKIKNAESLFRGQVMSGEAFELSNDVSNNAVALPVMPWFFSQYQMRSDNQDGRDRANAFKHAAVSPGYPTVFLKTEEDLFTNEFIGGNIHSVDTQIRLGGGPHTVYETYPLINLVRGNRESVYGGRTAQAYSRNKYIPLSKTIPVSKGQGVQVFDCGADTYVTLNIRTKNDAGDERLDDEEIIIQNGGGGRQRGQIKTFRRPAAWNYAVVLESQVEPKLDPEYQFYRESNKFRFDIIKTETINPAYFNEVNIKQFIPKPFKFKDDPNLGNVVAVSDVKLAGEIYDSWTMFKPNNFYAELDKNKGDVSNLVRWKGQIFAIQEDQTSLLYIGTDRIVNDQQGNPINIKQGSGTVVEGHNVISSYGTSIRRAVAVSDSGFSFFDEKAVEFVKVDKPLLVGSLLHLDYWNSVKSNPIADCEAYYDHVNKETVIRVRQRDGRYFTLSYNEALQVFNGEFEYDNDWYMPFDNKIFSPVKENAAKMHQLNEGDPLNLFESQKLLRVGVTVRADIDKVLQYKKTGIITNLDYPISNVIYNSSLRQSRIVTGKHHWYKIREGNHSIPAKNNTLSREEMADIRGNWITVDITAESKNQNKIDILALVNHMRISHQ